MSQITEAAVSIGIMVLSLAMISVLISGKSQTSSVINSISAGFANSISAATAPVTGSAATPVVSPGGGLLGGFNNLLPGG
jgi:uncharacterized membrane protein (DUF441 family)